MAARLFEKNKSGEDRHVWNHIERIIVLPLLQKQQNSLITGLRATNNVLVPPQDHVEEKGKEVSVDREEETETKACFIVCFTSLTTIQSIALYCIKINVSSF